MRKFLHINKWVLLALLLMGGPAECGELSSFSLERSPMKSWNEYGFQNITDNIPNEWGINKENLLVNLNKLLFSENWIDKVTIVFEEYLNKLI